MRTEVAATTGRLHRWIRRRLARPGAFDASLASFFYAGVTVFVFRRLWGRLHDAVPAGADDYLYLWNIWWAHRALMVEHVSPWFTDWIGYPEGTSLVLHSFGLSAFLPFLPLAGSGLGGVVLVHNLTVLTAFTLGSTAMYLLARDESGSRSGALFAGLAFGFAGIRLANLGWTDQMSVHFLVGYLLFLLRALRSGRARDAGAAGVCLAMVVYNSLTQVLVAALLSVGLVVGPALASRRTWAVAAAVGGTGLLLSTPFLAAAVRDRAAGLHWAEPPGIVSSWVVDPIDWVMPHHFPSLAGDWLAPVASERAAEWAELPARLRTLGTVYNQAALGYSLLAAVAVCVAGGGPSRGWRWLVLGALAASLSLGPSLVLDAAPPPDVARVVAVESDSLHLPYVWLRWAIPGMRMDRAPFRFMLPALLCLAVVASYGVRWLARPGPGTSRSRRALGAVAAALLLLGVLLECASGVPGIREIRSTEFSRIAAKEVGDFSVVFSASDAGLRFLEAQMLEQVVHGKRLLGGFTARQSYRVGGPQRPGLAWLEPEVPDPHAQVARARKLFASPELRVRYWVICGGGLRAPLLRAAARTYPMVWAEAPEAVRHLRQGEGSCWVFRVDRPKLAADRPVSPE